jgi:peroxiredoxin
MGTGKKSGSKAPRTHGSERGIAVSAFVGALGLLAFAGYAFAVSDGLSRHALAEWQIIAPDFEAVDPAGAKVVPDFTLPDRWGNPVSLRQFAQVDLLLVNIWSSGCRVCIEEAPSLADLDRRIGDLGRAALITIAIDEGWKDVAHHFPQGTDLRVLFDPDDKVGKGIFGTKAYPETFVLDRRRRIVARFDGKRPWHSRLMADYLERFLR